MNASAPIVVANESRRLLVAEQLQELSLKAGALLLEPVGRNTAPAIGENRLLALLGLKDVVVVDTDDALLVAHIDGMQEVKDIVAKLKADTIPQATWHRKVFLLWVNV